MKDRIIVKGGKLFFKKFKPKDLLNYISSDWIKRFKKDDWFSEEISRIGSFEILMQYLQTFASDPIATKTLPTVDGRGLEIYPSPKVDRNRVQESLLNYIRISVIELKSLLKEAENQLDSYFNKKTKNKKTLKKFICNEFNLYWDYLKKLYYSYQEIDKRIKPFDYNLTVSSTRMKIKTESNKIAEIFSLKMNLCEQNISEIAPETIIRQQWVLESSSTQQKAIRGQKSPKYKKRPKIKPKPIKKSLGLPKRR